MTPIAAHIQYLRNIKGYSENTCKAYEKALHKFVRSVRSARPDATWSTITRRDIDLFMLALRNKGTHASSINLYLSAISSQYKFFYREGLKVENPVKYESRQKIGETIPNTIPQRDLKRAFEFATGDGRLMLGLLYSTGMRIQELLDLTYRDIDVDNYRIKVRGKGNKQRYTYTTEEVLQYFKGIKNVHDRDAKIFDYTQREARYLIWQLVSPYTEAKQCSPHAIRHTFATLAAKAGASSMMIAKALGHRDIRTSQKYVNMAEIDNNRLTFNF